jgi:hypothetical protein
MKIVFDCGPLFKNYFSGEYDRYLIDAIFRLQKQKPQIDLTFVIDKSQKQLPPLVQSGTLVRKKKWPGNPGWKLWYSSQLPSVLKKTKADLLVTTGIVSKHVQIPQCVWVPGISRENFKKKKYFEWFRKNILKDLDRAAIIFADSEKNKKEISAVDSSLEQKIIVVPYAADDNAAALSWEPKEEIKKQYTRGREYFLVHKNNFSIEEFVALLKAFSQFKKRQQTNMQLVILGLSENKKIFEKLEGYKYRSDVHLEDEANVDIEKLFAAAYALLAAERSDRIILNAFSNEVPVIVNKEIFRHNSPYSDSVLSADFNDIHDLAHQLMLLYKDEKLRTMLLEKGTEVVKKQSAPVQSQRLWEGLSKALSSFENVNSEIKSSI